MTAPAWVSLASSPPASRSGTAILVRADPWVKSAIAASPPRRRGVGAGSEPEGVSQGRTAVYELPAVIVDQHRVGAPHGWLVRRLRLGRDDHPSEKDRRQ